MRLYGGQLLAVAKGSAPGITTAERGLYLSVEGIVIPLFHIGIPHAYVTRISYLSFSDPRRPFPGRIVSINVRLH